MSSVWRITSLAVATLVTLSVFCTGEVSGVTCPENYIKILGKCLLFVLHDETWDNASQFCRNNGGDLAMNLDDCPLYEELQWYMESHDTLRKTHFWVGGSDTELEGKWKWLNGDNINLGALYWGVYGGGENQPTVSTDYNCLFLNGGDRHRFNEGNCIVAVNFICQA